jgi:hypothetical protein
MKSTKQQRMILCAGLQSGGTTLVSWCFLQRHDTNGVLDMPSDVIQVDFARVKEPIIWCKTTVASFRWLDIYETYRDLDLEPEPLLVVRDVRATYTSLMKKWYGSNGTTAEDPPLRMRFRRFLRDWELFRQEGWPILKYEDLIGREREALTEICVQTRLDWDEGMLTWPKKRSEIAYVGDLNKTFEQTMESGSLARAKLPQKAEISLDGLPVRELQWLEESFASYNLAHGYPSQIQHPQGTEAPLSIPPPCFEGTAQAWLYGEIGRLRQENDELVAANQRLKEHRAVA